MAPYVQGGTISLVNDLFTSLEPVAAMSTWDEQLKTQRARKLRHGRSCGADTVGLPSGSRAHLATLIDASRGSRTACESQRCRRS